MAAVLGPRLTGLFADHRVQGHAIVPAAALLDLAGAVVRRRTGRHAVVLRDVVFGRPLALPEAGGPPVVLRCDLEPEGRFSVRSGGDGGTVHAHGEWAAETEDVKAVEWDELMEHCPTPARPFSGVFGAITLATEAMYSC